MSIPYFTEQLVGLINKTFDFDGLRHFSKNKCVGYKTTFDIKYPHWHWWFGTINGKLLANFLFMKVFPWSHGSIKFLHLIYYLKCIQLKIETASIIYLKKITF